MKKPVFFFAAITFMLFFVTQANANTHTLCNFPVNVAQYNSLQVAIDESGTGDTILVQGSPVAYGHAEINDKRLTIIGPGWKPLRQQPSPNAIVEYILINGAASSGTEIQGLYFQGGGNGGVITTELNVSINNIRIIRNYFEGNYILIQGIDDPGITSGYVIEGNYFYGSGIQMQAGHSFQNALIQNNVFNTITNGIANFAISSNVVFNHNLFYVAGYQGLFLNCKGLLVENNIFCKVDPGIDANYISNSSFKNNITFGTANAVWTMFGNIDLGGNVLNQDPKMTDQSSVNDGVNDPLLNFTVTPGPAKNTASDGKDMGLLFDTNGSRYNWNNSRNSRIPYVFKVDIPTNTIETNTTLNVSFEARRNN